jgi:multidrug efflux pump subunit AcrB
VSNETVDEPGNIDPDSTSKGIIAFFTRNTVASNLLMVFVLISGALTYFTIQRQLFPNIEVNMVNVVATYPGASPQEIEESILIKLEESLADVTEIEDMITRASRGSGRLTLKINNEADLASVVDKIKLRVDAVATLPAAMEPLTIYQLEFRQGVVELDLVGPLPYPELKKIAIELEDELLNLDHVSLVNVYTPADEIAVEIKPDILQKYKLSISDVSAAIERHSLNLSAGQLRTDSGIISVRVENQRYSGQEFENIPVIIGKDGAKVLLGDIADIKDAFTEDEIQHSKFNGKNSIHMTVQATREQDVTEVSTEVKAWVQDVNQRLPKEIRLETLVDTTKFLSQRLSMMLSNLMLGALLVGIVLSIFLHYKLALWVMAGLPVCFLGAVMFMPSLGVSINIISLFAFIMVLGIVVDDAIVIGESVYTEIEHKGNSIDTVVRGAQRVATPATFGVLTTIAVFLPFTFSSGPEAAMFKSISYVVALCLAFSLIESKLILPSHLAHTKIEPPKNQSWRVKFNDKCQNFINQNYRQFLLRCVEWRWLSFSIFLAGFMISVSLITSEQIRFTTFPESPHDFPSIQIEMNDNIPDAQLISSLETIENMIIDVDREIESKYGNSMIENRNVWAEDRTSGVVLVSLIPEEERPMNTFELAKIWSERLPEIPALKSITIIDDPTSDSVAGDFGRSDFGYLIRGDSMNDLSLAGRELIASLNKIEGVYNVSSSLDPLGKEIQLRLKPIAYDLGLNLANVGQQLGANFYGGEAQRVIRNGEELKVMVRYPEKERRALSSLEKSWIETPAGGNVMLGDVAEIIEVPGISTIRRENSSRSVFVWGFVNKDTLSTRELTTRVSDTVQPTLKQKYPELDIKLSGSIIDQNAQVDEQIRFFVIGMLVVYILLAIPLKSYGQPLIIMSVIPFSAIGSIFAHFIFGIDFSMMSTFGLIAAAGVVINDSLVMTDYINKIRLQGVPIANAVVQAGCARFRAITLTSVTTFVGVTPIMFEKSMQAQIIVPMAVSLGFAVLFATVVTLILVPSLYLIIDDVKSLFRSKDAPVELTENVA